MPEIRKIIFKVNKFYLKRLFKNYLTLKIFYAIFENENKREKNALFLR